MSADATTRPTTVPDCATNGSCELGNKPTPSKSKSFGQEIQLVICALGIYACYLRYGLLQERIYSASHGEESEKFSYSLFLVAMQTATNALVALIVLLVTQVMSKPTASEDKQQYNPKTKPSPSRFVIRGVPVLDYAVVSLAYLSAMVFSFTALNHMSYPMQALGKSSKMIPVMLMGIVIRKRRYSMREFICVFMVSAGVALFSWKSKSSKVPSSPLGFALLFASLFMDGVTGPLQERLIANFNPSTHQLMFWQNFTSVAWLAVALLITGEGASALNFVMKYPETMSDIMLFSIVSAVGQNFIFYTVRHFNALVVTTITTTRKMFTILLSIFVYKHSVAPRQWLGLVLVFIAITWEAIAKQRAKAKRAASQLVQKKDQ